MQCSPRHRRALAVSACDSAGTRVERPHRGAPRPHSSAVPTPRYFPPTPSAPPPFGSASTPHLVPAVPRPRLGTKVLKTEPRKRIVRLRPHILIASPGGAWVLRSAKTGELRPLVRRWCGPHPPLLPPTPRRRLQNYRVGTHTQRGRNRRPAELVRSRHGAERTHLGPSARTSAVCRGRARRRTPHPPPHQRRKGPAPAAALPPTPEPPAQHLAPARC
jgi:hypothetical protein